MCGQSRDQGKEVRHFPEIKTEVGPKTSVIKRNNTSRKCLGNKTKHQIHEKNPR